MQQSYTKGKLMGSRFLHDYFLISCVAVTIILCFTVIIWVEAITSRENRTATLSVAFLFSMFFIFCIFSGHKTARLVLCSYECTNRNILIHYGRDSYTLSFSEPFFFSKIRIRFAYGKANTARDFIVFSPNPLNSDFLLHSGCKAIKCLFDSGAVIIPLKEDTRRWMSEDLGIKSVPNYPKVGYQSQIQ